MSRGMTGLQRRKGEMPLKEGGEGKIEYPQLV